MAEQPEEKHDAWSSYPETVLIFAGDPAMMIDLREPVSPATRNALAAIGMDSPFAILTSYDPRGVVLSAAENDRRFAELEAELRSSKRDYLVMDACSPDKSHCERSAAIKIGRADALLIAERWEQLAIFWWDLERFWIYGAINPTDPPISLPVSRHQAAS